MAEFCSQCDPFDDFDTDLVEIALNLERGHSYSFVCEGCENRALYKDESGILFLAKRIGGELEWVEVKIEQLQK